MESISSFQYETFENWVLKFRKRYVQLYVEKFCEKKQRKLLFWIKNFPTFLKVSFEAMRREPEKINGIETENDNYTARSTGHGTAISKSEADKGIADRVFSSRWISKPKFAISKWKHPNLEMVDTRFSWLNFQEQLIKIIEFRRNHWVLNNCYSLFRGLQLRSTQTNQYTEWSPFAMIWKMSKDRWWH